MRMIFETVEGEDYFEVILTPDEIALIPKKGIVKDFPFGLYGKRNLNIYIRQQNELDEEEEDAT